MAGKSTTFALESGLDLRQVVTTGSVLHINDVYDEESNIEPDQSDSKQVDILGKPVPNFSELEKTMLPVDQTGYVKKKIIEEGGGLPLHDVYTVSVAFSGYWENDQEPFDSRKLHKPLVVDLKENGLLPGLQMAIRSMLVGETSLFLFSHQVMYGEMGVPPRIRPKSKCAFYIKLIKSILTPLQGDIDFSLPNMFHRVLYEARLLYSSGGTLYRTNNFPAAIHLFKKAISMLHKCRLANENEEKIQERMLVKLYLNLAICYNKTKQPLRTCTVCNELNRLSCLWNNDKALFQNAKALRMIGEFDIAEKRLRRAVRLYSYKGIYDPRQDDAILAEIEALRRARRSCNQTKLVQKVSQARSNQVTYDFKREVDYLIRNFKENGDLCKLIMPSGLNAAEVAYIRDKCIRENLFFNKVRKDFALEDEENVTNVKNILNPEENYSLDKFDDKLIHVIEDDSQEEDNVNDGRNEDNAVSGENEGTIREHEGGVQYEERSREYEQENVQHEEANCVYEGRNGEYKEGYGEYEEGYGEYREGYGEYREGHGEYQEGHDEYEERYGEYEEGNGEYEEEEEYSEDEDEYTEDEVNGDDEGRNADDEEEDTENEVDGEQAREIET